MMMVMLMMVMAEILIVTNGISLIAQLEQVPVHHLFELESVEMGITLTRKKAEMMEIMMMVMADLVHVSLKLVILDLVVVVSIQTSEQQYEPME